MRPWHAERIRSPSTRAPAQGVPATLVRCRGYVGETYQQAPHEAPGHEFCP
jgi:hypothetical protein